MNTIVFVLKMLILTSNPSLTVDRVESDRAPVAVVCSSDACFNVRTVRGKGGLREGQTIARKVTPEDVCRASAVDYDASECDGLNFHLASNPEARALWYANNGNAQLGCETFTRGDGTRAVVCQGHTVAFVGTDGTRHANPYYASVY